MTLNISDTRMTSDACPNVAELRDHRWSVTGYPGRTFDRLQAITAMLLAEVLTQRRYPEDRIELLATTWRAELGITEADGPHIPTAATTPEDRPDEQRSDRASSPTTTWDAASSAKTTTAPHDPATSKSDEVHTS
ncbi:hypothetical protein ABT294_41115 [Nonomuraea sp. NPDC000554]|uniref:hypothetical protein n=1 Tax=Nonomuraea sp. NPDC000554 TaxID=3154259 RepID=UPI00332ECBD8